MHARQYIHCRLKRGMALPVTYDVLVIGAGMMGSAAARYASEMKGLRVGIIGPAEPTEVSL